MTDGGSFGSKFWSKTSYIQAGYGLWVSLVDVGTGMSFGFPATALPELTHPDSPIQINMSDAVWIGLYLTIANILECIYYIQLQYLHIINILYKYHV
jgi:hypothetical protein